MGQIHALCACVQVGKKRDFENCCVETDKGKEILGYRRGQNKSIRAGVCCAGVCGGVVALHL